MTSQIADNFLSSEFKELKFEDGGVYCGGTRGGKAHGHGVCTGPGGEGQYSGAWSEGFESSGSYVWPNGNVYYGQWMQGKRHGLGMEKRGHWVYQGEMTNGLMGKYGVKKDQRSLCRFEGTWASGVQCGYGVEVYSDGGTYIGQWLKGSRQGYGIRTSSTFEKSSKSPQTTSFVRKFSLTLARSEPELVIKEVDRDSKLPPSITDLFPPTPPASKDKHHLNAVKISPVNRIGFFLKGRDKEVQQSAADGSNSSSGVTKKFSEALKLGGGSGGKSASNDGDDAKSKQDQRGRSVKEGGAAVPAAESKVPVIGNLLTDIVSGNNPSSAIDLKSVPADAVEIYSGEWKNDKRSGFGVCHRSDGLRYEGEWSDNCKNGFGATTFPDGSREEGCYKNNHIQEPSKRMLMLKLGKLKEQLDSAVISANKAAQIAAQKAEIALSRAKTAVSKMEQAIQVVDKSILDSKIAQCQLAAHLEQRKHNSGFKSNVDVLNQLQPQLQQQQQQQQQMEAKTPEIVANAAARMQDTSGAPVKHSSETALNLRRSGSWHWMGNPSGRLQPSRVASSIHNVSVDLRSSTQTPGTRATNQRQDAIPDFYDSQTNFVTFSEKPDRDEEIASRFRRSTMPSIVKYPNASSSQSSLRSLAKFEPILEEGNEPSPLKLSSYIVQNGRKRLLSSSQTIVKRDEHYAEPRWDEYVPKQTPEQLPNYRLKAKRWMSKVDVRSVPDVRYVNMWETKVLPKREAQNMCKKVREEKQKLLELQAELRKRSIIIKIGEIKAWCKKHLAEIFIFSVNISIAAVFYSLLK